MINEKRCMSFLCAIFLAVSAQGVLAEESALDQLGPEGRAIQAGMSLLAADRATGQFPAPANISERYRFIGAGEIEVKPEPLVCIFAHAGMGAELTIDSEEDYQKLLQYKVSMPFCKNFSLPEIDFSQRILLGKFTTGTGCKVSFVRQVFIDELNAKFTYVVGKVQEGACEKFVQSMNWISIPKPPQGYTIEFKEQ